MGLSAILGIVGSVVSAAGSLIAAQGQAAVAEWNAARQEEEARREKSAGIIRAQLEQRKAQELAGRARAAQAASGAVTTEGTSLLLLEEIEQEGEYAARVQETNSAQTARGLENSAIAERYEGKIAQTAGFFGAATSLIGGIGKVAQDNKWGIG